MRYFAILLSLASILMSARCLAEEKKYLALGDSYTVGTCVTEFARWPNQLAKALKHKGINLSVPRLVAAKGWRTDDLKEAIQDEGLKNDYDLVSLLVGVNDQHQGSSPTEYAIEFEGLLVTAIQLAKGNRENVFVVSIPDYGYTPYGEEEQREISREIDQFNTINKAITQKYGITYVDITDFSRLGLKDSTLMADDGLHPSGKMYGLWVKRIANEPMFQHGQGSLDRPVVMTNAYPELGASLE